MSEFIYHMRRNSMLTFGVITLLFMLVLWLIGYLWVDVKNAAPLSAPTDLPPSREHPLGTDSAGVNYWRSWLRRAGNLAIGLIAGVGHDHWHDLGLQCRLFW
ncbi:MAG: hypothetical protein R2932_55795 [Caldilineaceae bacterium]